MNESLPNLDGAERLCWQIELAWSRLDVPHLDERLMNNREIAGMYDLVANKHWKEVEVNHRKFKGECWIDWLPPDAQGYYLASLLYYCVELVLHPEDVEDRAFLCVVYLLRHLSPLREAYSAEQVECVLSSISFIREHLDFFGFQGDEEAGELDQAEASWSREG